MKKSLLIICMMLGMATAFAQNKAVNKAEQLLKQNKLSEAKEQIDAAVNDEKTKDKAKTWYTRGQIYAAIATSEDASVKAISENAIAEAAQSFRKAQELEPNPTSPFNALSDQALNGLWGVYINNGAKAYEAQNYEVAVVEFDKALQVIPTDTTASLYAGVAAQQLGDRDRSAKYFYNLLDAGYADKDIFYTLIAYERDQKQDYAKAREVIKRGKEAFPDEVEFRKQEVALLLKEDKTSEAVNELKQAISAEPKNPDLHFNLGYLNEELGDQAAAIAAYKKALEVDPTHKNSAFNLAVIHYNRAADLVKEANNLGLSKEEAKKGAEMRKRATEYFKEAVPYVENALRLHPDNRTLMEITMVTYDRAGEKAKADALSKQLDSME
ncbi:tetratricopeptide repeat protein [Cesiribacter andamanensis]|uniref:Lipoprotein NlpI n=1 Tax=Cesiribacter andamanensis AMV16 TaxID=1279009 RepID=M7N6G6_9BACT|nr:tetratricopeptide repeat protein [Cesiribacter andamanensis]EMR02872.1 Lipoprotein NlpI precursor [Cesiribacter andamanensis AMV16]